MYCRGVIFDDLNFSRCKLGRFKRAAFQQMSMSMANTWGRSEKKVFNSPFRKRSFDMWPIKNGVKMKIRLGQGSRWKETQKKMAAVLLYSYDRVGGSCFPVMLPVCRPLDLSAIEFNANCFNLLHFQGKSWNTMLLPFFANVWPWRFRFVVYCFACTLTHCYILNTYVFLAML